MGKIDVVQGNAKGYISESWQILLDAGVSPGAEGMSLAEGILSALEIQAAAAELRYNKLAEGLVTDPGLVTSIKPEPDTKTLQFLSDVITAAGLLAYGRQSKALAARISRAAFDLNSELYDKSEKKRGLAKDDLQNIIWNDALEEAALICDGVNNHDNPMTASDCADAIREMKSVKSNDENYEWNEGDDEHS